MIHGDVIGTTTVGRDRADRCVHTHIERADRCIHTHIERADRCIHTHIERADRCIHTHICTCIHTQG
jgi:hypothetical protein